MKQVFKVVSQSAPLPYNRQDGTQSAKSNIVLQEVGGQKENKMKRIKPQQQVWKHLLTDDQRAIFAQNLRHLKPRSQEDLCYGLLAYIRWGIVRPFEDPWINRIYQSLIIYIKTEKALGSM